MLSMLFLRLDRGRNYKGHAMAKGPTLKTLKLIRTSKRLQRYKRFAKKLNNGFTTQR